MLHLSLSIPVPFTLLTIVCKKVFVVVYIITVHSIWLDTKDVQLLLPQHLSLSRCSINTWEGQWEGRGEGKERGGQG